MIHRKNFYFALLMLVSALAMMGCNDDNETPVINDDTPPADEVVETS